MYLKVEKENIKIIPYFEFSNAHTERILAFDSDDVHAGLPKLF